MKDASRWGTFLLVAGVLGGSPLRAAAYCANPDQTVAQEFDESAAVFVGRVMSVRDAAALCPDPGWTYELAVERVFRGKIGKRAEVVTENNSGRYPLEVGGEYLLFAKTGCRPLMIFGGCGHSVPLAEAAPTLRELEAISKTTSGPAAATPANPLQRPAVQQK